MNSFDLKQYSLSPKDTARNISPARLYELAIQEQSIIASSGALIAYSGSKTGRSPADKRVVRHPESENNVWWGQVNIPLTETTFAINRERAINYLSLHDRLFVVDAFAGWSPTERLKVRVICSRAYHALFMQNMLIMPTEQELKEFGTPDVVIFNAGRFPANHLSSGMTSDTTVDLSLEQKELVILGTEYAGEMKKGVFTMMNYLMPLKGHLSMHCSATEGDKGDVALLFGLSGTGKTTLSADPKRKLIGDDEHVWTAQGVFNIEGGCYAKTLDLSREAEPEIFDAIRFGTVLENVVIDEVTREVKFGDSSITKNTRASYPLTFIPSAKIPAVGGLPNHVIFLTCDAFGVLPPLSKLTPEQAMYHFISGYTAKVAGTEMGVSEPEATFSPCFGGPFMVWHPSRYAELLAEKLAKDGAQTWLVNTGWSGGAYGIGKRIQLKDTRALIDCIYDGSAAQAQCLIDSRFGFSIPLELPGLSSALLQPKATWKDEAAYDKTADALVQKFRKNFEQYANNVSASIINAGPKLAQ